MVQSAIQTAFHTGEWSPSLYARVDLQKYHAAAALLRNFYVDYRGGASTRPGTKYINQCKKSSTPVRLVPFQPTPNTTYVLEFGDGYIRFFTNGSVVLETAINITGISGNTVTAVNSYSAGDWVFIGSSFFIVLTAGAGSFTVSDIWGNASVTPSGTTSQRVYTITSPFAATDLFPNPNTGNPGIKFVQSVNTMIICHPSYPPQVLTINSATNWTIAAITFGATLPAPSAGLSLVTNLTVAASNWNYAYTVTAVDVNGQESVPATLQTLTGFKSLGDTTAPGTNTLSWTAVSGAQSYNVYKANPQFNVAFATGVLVGFIGNTTATSFSDTTPGIGANFALTPPIAENPFQGAGVSSYTVTANGAYTTVPTVTVGAAPAGGSQATAVASLGIVSSSLVDGGTQFVVGTIYNVFGTSGGGTVFATLTPLTVGGAGPGNILTYSIVWAGSITSGTTPSNNLVVHSPNGSDAHISATWGVTAVNPIMNGAGYTSAPSVTFSAGAAAATAVLGTVSGGNPGCPGFLQQRLCLAGLAKSPMTFNMSQTATFFNFNISNPIQATDAISGTIFSGELNDIKSLTPVPTGLLVLSGRLAWIINGGGGLSAYNPITPSNAVANPQTFTGANDLPPLKINQDLLYVTHKGNYIRDLNYNIYANVFSGNDISVLSSHLFFNHYLTQWAWAEEPFKVAWAIRDDGVMLSLTYVKDQELIGWCHHDTNGQFKSVCSVLETVNGNSVEAVYVVAQRTINGQTIQNVERLQDRYFTYGKEDSWSVDCALQTTANTSPTSNLTVTGNASVVGNSVTLTDTVGAPFTATMATNSWVVRAGGGIYTITAFTSASVVTASVTRVPTLIDPYTNVPYVVTAGYGIWQPVTSVSNLTQLIGQTVTGVADGVVVTGTVSSTGGFSLPNAATKVTIGLAFTPQLQTLPLDLGSPTIQGKPKQINAVTVRVADTLGLSIGTNFSTIVAMKESQVGNQNYYLNATVSDLISADTRTQIDSTWTIPGQYCIQQTLPYPASILGVIPEFSSTQRAG